MKRAGLIAALTSIIITISTALCFADSALKLVSSYPEDGQKNTSMENLGVKLTFNNPINSKSAQKINKAKFAIYDEDGKAIPVDVLFSEDEEKLILVLADTDKGFVAKNNSEYKLVIDAGVVDNQGNALGQEQTVTFRTYNQRVNNMVNMVMMFVMFGGIMFISLRQTANNNKPAEESSGSSKEAFNPYREAKRTGKTVEEVEAEHRKKEEKLAKKRARKGQTAPVEHDNKIENCAELLNNVYHVHAPAPVNKVDRSIEALRESRRAAAKTSGSKGKGKNKGKNKKK